MMMKPDFIKGSQHQTIVSKYESFDLYLLKESFQHKTLKTSVVLHTLNFSVYDGTQWHTIQGNTEISDDWHHAAAVVDDTMVTLYLDGKLEGKVKLEKEVPLGFSSEAGKCQQQSCIVDVKMSTSDADLAIGAYVTKKFDKICCDDDGFIKTVAVPTAINKSYGQIEDLTKYPEAFSEKQIAELYRQDENRYQKDTVTDFVPIGTESPALSDSECLDLAKERAPGALAQADTLVCQFPFNVVIPLNSSILWIETLPSGGGPYHMMRSVDNLFATTSAPFTLMNFNEPEFTYGAYEYVDNLNESLTGKIVIAKHLESTDRIGTTGPILEIINVTENSAGPDCGIDNSCYDPFAVSVDVRKKITWRNLDSFSHTITSGTPEDGPDGVFNSGILAGARYFSHTFYETGYYDYYCTLHPWMEGIVVVGEI
jgi:plastocyanin